MIDVITLSPLVHILSVDYVLKDPAELTRLKINSVPQPFPQKLAAVISLACYCIVVVQNHQSSSSMA